MFVRRGSADSDLAAVAQRRLAALAQQFELARAGGHLAEAEAVDAPDGAGPAVPPPEVSVRGRGGRHSARRDGARWRLTPHQLTIAALLTLAAVLVAAWWVLRSVPDAEPVQLTSERTLPSVLPTDPGAGASPVSTPTGGAPASTPPGATLVVDVTGKVRRPGIVELPAGSRVIDALDAAGGARLRVDTSTLNLARPLVDGEQIVVGLDVPVVPGAPGAVPTSGLPASPALTPVNLNLATQLELEELPGIGPVTATAILTWRTEHGTFTSVEELLEVSGIGDATLADIAPYVYV